MSLLTASCSKSETPASGPSALRDVPAVRLNYRYEADVPPPPLRNSEAADERNAAVQQHFDQTRPQELLDLTISSPDKNRIVAVYHKVGDQQSEFRLDMYSADGKLLRKITSDLMAVHFPDTILWSPDSSTLAFVAMLRAVSLEATPTPLIEPSPTPDETANANSTDTNTESEPAASPAAPTPAPPSGILLFRTEQLYISNSEGENTKPITQSEGKIYFYYVWSPDSTMLATLAATAAEWRYMESQIASKPERFIPVGRPRIVEKTGRERLLDDNLTSVSPVWSPDSAKVAVAFDTQVRIYDAVGNTPTQAAIPLKNHFLISSLAYDREQQRKLEAGNADANAPPANAEQPITTLPDEKSLVSFNPIVSLEWPGDDLLYVRTAFIKRMKNEADSVSSFPRWHRLILTPQITAVNR